MGSSKSWRFSEHMPVSIQAALAFVSLVCVFSLVSYQILPTSSWGDNFGSLLLGVSWVPGINNNSTSAAPGVEDLSSYAILFEQSPPPPLAPSVSANVSIDLSVSEAPLVATFPPIESAFSPNSSKSGPHPAGAAILNATSILAPAPSVTEEDHREKFMVPMLSGQVGAGNQLMEYVSAAVIARSLNRTLCVVPFFRGPFKHLGSNVSTGLRAFSRRGKVGAGLSWEERFELSSLSRFTRVAPLERCLEQCNYTLDDTWTLRVSRHLLIEKWKKYPSDDKLMNLNWTYLKWTKTKDITASLGNRNERCVGIQGLFPGLRWRGAFLAISAFLKPAPLVVQLADALQKYAFGENTPYLAVHWRFEESECGPHSKGLCFVRCEDGSVINSGIASQAVKEWHDAAAIQCNRGGHFRGVMLDKTDILDAIQERACNFNVSTVYLATDGWMRGPYGVRLLQEAVTGLRQRGLKVAGLWTVPGLANFIDGKVFDPVITFGPASQNLTSAHIALVEQELCSRAVSFLGSGQSTWSLSVFRVRLARRRAEQIVEAAELDRSVDLEDPSAVDRLISDTLLQDQHPAGLHCRYVPHMKLYPVNETVETNADEYPDGWLDLEACEGRLGRGGRCEVAKCF